LYAFLLVGSAALVAGCTTSRPAPVSDRTATPRVAAAKPVPKPAAGAAESTPGPRGAVSAPERVAPPTPGIVAAPLKTPGGSVEAKPLATPGTAAAPSAPAASARPATAASPASPPPTAAASAGAPGPAARLTEPKAVRLPYSDQALAQLAAADATPPAPKPEARVEMRLPPPPRESSGDTARGPANGDWIWPAKGKLLVNFNGTTSKGIDIAGKRGQPVLASAAGRVIFSGTGVRGMGKFIVIKHTEDLISVYGHNDEIFVKYGQSVTRGQKIAEMGSTDTDQVKLHFEIRRNGTPIDPLTLLPSPA
jgi:lipoprotein NlpD